MSTHSLTHSLTSPNLVPPRHRRREDPRAAEGLALGPMPDKEQRRALHQWVSKTFPQLSTTTIPTAGAGNGGGPMVGVAWAPASRRQKGQKRKRGDGDGDGDGTPLLLLYRFVLRKENVEHLDALAQLAHALRAPPAALAHAGVKDRRAVTYQYLTARLSACGAQEGAGRFGAVRVPGACVRACVRVDGWLCMDGCV